MVGAVKPIAQGCSDESGAALCKCVDRMSDLPSLIYRVSDWILFSIRSARSLRKDAASAP